MTLTVPVPDGLPVVGYSCGRVAPVSQVLAHIVMDLRNDTSTQTPSTLTHIDTDRFLPDDYDYDRIHNRARSSEGRRRPQVNQSRATGLP